jgi:glycosyltransferase involved in cell wall biosynthesis
LRKGGQKKVEKISSMTIYRHNVLRSRSKRINYAVEYLSFLLSVFIGLSKRHLKNRYGLIHINNMPDILVFTGLLAKITGAKIILDLHDPMPEVFMTKYGTSEKSLSVRILIFLERACIRFSDRIITTNIAFRDLFIERGCPPEKIDIVMNSPDDEIFTADSMDRLEPKQPEKPFKVVFNGTIVERHGLDSAIDAILKLTEKIPNITFDIYGDGDFVEKIYDRVKSLGEKSAITYKGFVHVNELVKIISNADVGVIPNIRSVFTEINFPVRIFEYLILKKPIIAPNTRGIRDYFTQENLLLFDPGNFDDLAEKIYFVYANPEKAREMVRKGYEIYERHCWRIQKEVLLKIYDDSFCEDLNKFRNTG